MKKILSLAFSILFLSISVVLFTTCSKGYSYEGGLINGNIGGTAIYTFIGASGTCTGSILSGKYVATTQLTSANTIQLQVNVTTIGSYSVSTNSSNGFQFSGSGSFIDTGNQVITLTGAGTPTTEGSFTFTTPIGLGCSFTVPVTKLIAGFTLVGAPNNCQNVTVYGTYVYGNKLTTANYVEINVNVTTAGPYILSTDTIDGIHFSASGTFTKTGVQTVDLIGSGTPNVPQNLTFTPINGNSSCTFNVSVVNPEPQATYVLESGFGTSQSPCIYTVAGNYAAQTSLSGSNTVTLNVYVTVVGNFTIATNTINGISFAYVGSFTSLGAQTVTIIGTGTPIASGTFSFTPQIVGPHPLGGESCGFNVTIQ